MFYICDNFTLVNFIGIAYLIVCYFKPFPLFFILFSILMPFSLFCIFPINDGIEFKYSILVRLNIFYLPILFL